ncbi:hypothetical protein NX722_10810 [Endozoicomonas gorgoniicola]|uniref:Uncharacterized protein n=1 Tax=Endozoicomonas gorgoniicola TaxID=1234144 RepID=A0ABT3MUQ3_9GAMM|nr:hypothetical protein [Endozoicomonas gorgoniicola]MCW7553116.1 hypothetical protein [Endozoicomonas gorgoniicola]
MTKSILFQNTTLLEGTTITAPDSKGERRFYGYAFLPDDQDILDVFSKGFYPRHLECYPRELTEVSTSRRIRGVATIQSYICHYAAYQYIYQRITSGNEIYLVDLREVGGIVKRASTPAFCCHGYRQGDSAFQLFPFTREYHRLETLAPVPGEAVIGMVTSFKVRTYFAPLTKLKLHINPGYRQGVEGVRAIADLFNGESDWVMV